MNNANINGNPAFSTKCHLETFLFWFRKVNFFLALKDEMIHQGKMCEKKQPKSFLFILDKKCSMLNSWLVPFCVFYNSASQILKSQFKTSEEQDSNPVWFDRIPT